MAAPPSSPAYQDSRIAFAFSFALAAEGTVAEGAEVDLVSIPGDEIILESITLAE